MSEQSTDPRQPVLVGVDGSDSSRRALKWALDYAALIGAPVRAVISWHYPTSYGMAAAVAGWDPQAEARTVLADSVTAVCGPDSGATVTQVVREGHPSRMLLDESKDAELLVVGSRGHGGFAGMLLGSVSAACAEHASCPVLVVHP